MAFKVYYLVQILEDKNVSLSLTLTCFVPEHVSVSKVGGSRGMLPWENFKLKSFEMAINVSKTAISSINL